MQSLQPERETILRPAHEPESIALHTAKDMLCKKDVGQAVLTVYIHAPISCERPYFSSRFMFRTTASYCLIIRSTPNAILCFT
jgi:hypothetical protein